MALTCKTSTPLALPIEDTELRAVIRTFAILGETPGGRRFIGDLIPRVVSRYISDEWREHRNWEVFLRETMDRRQDFLPSNVRGDLDIIDQLGLETLCQAELVGVQDKPGNKTQRVL